ncbi:hypothetical protein EIN_088230 [Entamoeba invadens IP1]|uniref:Uncharacterized protein n=2 Tax=Entamoeba invadens IP1 TaxID=370355 RepID=L7FP25_ENTIV|nr:hypothetical protein EIN_088230 [Entamoeba invadens IP1]ELP94493.1 hypothetical protein EIN_088230 [Entamoeba invadens IP1]|eukprot:XP_004261264.1 hypothetical protein EIN_088230 [Entamoeba invadens IP1]
MTVMLDDKSVLMTDSSCYLIVQTFKMMGNIVVRFSAVQCLRNLINADAKFFEVFKKNGGCDALLDVCLGKDERQENQEQPDKRVRYESTRILVSILKTDKDRLNDFARTDEVYKCLLENLKTDFALLIKEVMTLIIQFMDWGFSIPNEVLVEIRAVVKDKLETLLKSPAENQTMNKDVLDVFEKFLNH